MDEIFQLPETRTILLAVVSRKGILDPIPLKDALNPDDYFSLRRSVPNIEAASPRMSLPRARALANGRATDVVVEGLDVDGITMMSRHVTSGTSFSRLDVARDANVCLLSESLAEALFPNQSPLQRSVQINKSTFTIVGTVNDASGDAESLLGRRDLRVYLPFTSLLSRLNNRSVMSLTFQTLQLNQVRSVQALIDQEVEKRRGSRKSAFFTNNTLDNYTYAAKSSQTLRNLLAILGVVSLLVGGIGIMNIMLVGVQERTREIGIRVALGTPDRGVFLQFLVEASVLSLLGGIVGVGIGIAASFVFTQVNGWPIVISPGAVILAVTCSLAVGLFFGLHPARRAAKMNPVQALRTEQ
jgi:putative ABC transport system permease protein